MDWASTMTAVAAALSLFLSITVAVSQHRFQTRSNKTASVTAYFHRTKDWTHVTLNDGTEAKAGYHLVLWNQGPASAEDLELLVCDGRGTHLTLVDSPAEEFPLKRLDAGGRYPIPWIVEPRRPGIRRVIATLRWQDGRGPQERQIPLRRGETNM